VRIRAVTPDDLSELLSLIAEHAEYEKAARPPAELGERLPALLFGEGHRLHAFVAESDAGVVGYTSASVEVSTWTGREYLHMDCLFLRDAGRGAGVGPQLMSTLRELADGRGIREMRWQTPAWNDGAIRFYDRTDGVRSSKQRYILAL
jgi:GNAT superfamily N-acetyltransferase